MEPKEPTNQPQNQPQDVLEPESTSPAESVTPPATSEKPVSPTPPVAVKKRSLNLPLILGGGVGLLLVIIGIVVVSLLHGKSSPGAQTPNVTVTSTPTVQKSAVPSAKDTSELMIYGVWSAQSSVIKSFDLTKLETTTLATLPLDIRKVTILNPTTVMYIDQTDEKDHGKRMTFYNFKEKTLLSGIAAADGFLIYDYLLSPDKKYLTLWEVKPGQTGLTGGNSRIYAIDMSNFSISNLLYDETISDTIPAHYPRAILDNGTVLTDTFLPNSTLPYEITYGYGMSTVDVDGTNRKDIDPMISGTYSSMPILSPDGTYLLFSGYDGSLGEGNIVVNGFRQAMLDPNTVELLNTKSFKRFRLPNVPNDTTYTQVAWNQITTNVILTALAADKRTTNYYAYDLAKKSMQQFDFPTSSTAAYSYVSQLPNGKTLMGIADNQPANYGNLGENYAYAFTNFALLDAQKNQTNVPVQDQFLQFMTILPGDYFTKE